MALKALHNLASFPVWLNILTYLASAPLESLLFLEYTRHSPVSGSLHWPFSSLWHSFFKHSHAPSPPSNLCLNVTCLERHSLTTIFFKIVTPIYIPIPITLLHFLSWYISLPNIVYHLFVCYILIYIIF